MYVGSANLDWRSLAQVKELGLLVEDCPALARDVAKMWEVYWMLGGEGKKIPDRLWFHFFLILKRGKIT